MLYREAQERGDLYATTNLSTFYGTIIKLAANECPESESSTEAFLNARSGRPLNLEHTSAFDALMQIDLYRGDVTRAWARLAPCGPSIPGRFSSASR